MCAATSTHCKSQVRVKIVLHVILKFWHWFTFSFWFLTHLRIWDHSNMTRLLKHFRHFYREQVNRWVWTRVIKKCTKSCRTDESGRTWMIIVQAAKTNDLPITNKLATTENQPVVFFLPLTHHVTLPFNIILLFHKKYEYQCHCHDPKFDTSSASSYLSLAQRWGEAKQLVRV